MARRRYDNRVSAWRRGYDAAWHRVRTLHLHAEPLCRLCRMRGRVVAATVVDHIVPITDRPELRLVDENLRSLCKTCHDTLGDGQRPKGCDANGVPLAGW